MNQRRHRQQKEQQPDDVDDCLRPLRETARRPRRSAHARCAAACNAARSRKIAANRYHWISSQALELMLNMYRMNALPALIRHGHQHQPHGDAADAVDSASRWRRDKRSSDFIHVPSAAWQRLHVRCQQRLWRLLAAKCREKLTGSLACAHSLRHTATCAVHPCGAVPPGWLRAATEPSIDSERTSSSISGENCLQFRQRQFGKCELAPARPTSPRAPLPRAHRETQRPCAPGNRPGRSLSNSLPCRARASRRVDFDALQHV